ncbi:hypothetical protein EHO61_08010 [Leptospira fluminis]|uniref:Porin n=1 Tax=Leptospira fluminis TaxID=2484979 RepID=A0A4R9GQD6_9LEPT|nr:hypothetical protein [Leptospira fluminis]TGK19405.1 hypothetical protein EHO61_08010 [Leptospira fluminis]
MNLNARSIPFKRVFSVLFLSISLPLQLDADEVVLRSGRRLSDLTLEKEGTDDFIFSFSEGIPIRIPKSEIVQHIRSQNVPTKEEKSSEMLTKDQIISKISVSTGPEKKRDFDLTWSQSLTNDVFINGNSFFGNAYVRRGDLKYSSLPRSLILDTAVNIPTNLEGLNLTIRELSPLNGRTNRDVDGGFQAAPFAPDVSLSQALQNPGVYKKRTEMNGLRDALAAVLMYRWRTNRLGDFSTGMIYYANTQPDFALGLFTAGWNFPFLTYLNPSYFFNIRFTSERIGGASIGGQNDMDSGYPTNAFNGSTFHRFSIHHEYDITKDFKVQPGIDLGYQYYNDNIDRRSGFKNLDFKLMVRYLSFFASLTDVYRPNTYMIDNNYYYPNIVGGQTVGVVPGASTVQPLTANSNDGLTVNPSKSYGTSNEIVLNSITNSNLDPNIKQALVNHHLAQRIPLHSVVWSFGYSIRL